jgi:hypothetical protein
VPKVESADAVLFIALPVAALLTSFQRDLNSSASWKDLRESVAAFAKDYC